MRCACVCAHTYTYVLCSCLFHYDCKDQTICAVQEVIAQKIARNIWFKLFQDACSEKHSIVLLLSPPSIHNHPLPAHRFCRSGFHGEEPTLCRSRLLSLGAFGEGRKLGFAGSAVRSGMLDLKAALGSWTTTVGECRQSTDDERHTHWRPFLWNTWMTVFRWVERRMLTWRIKGGYAVSGLSCRSSQYYHTCDGVVVVVVGGTLWKRKLHCARAVQV